MLSRNYFPIVCAGDDTYRGTCGTLYANKWGETPALHTVKSVSWEFDGLISIAGHPIGRKRTVNFHLYLLGFLPGAAVRCLHAVPREYNPICWKLVSILGMLLLTAVSACKLTPPVLAPPLFWNILYHSRQLAHRHFNNALLTHFFSNLLHLFNVLSPLI